MKKKSAVPSICKGCKNAKYFVDGGACNMYWDGKTYCSTRYWIEKIEWER